ncbi:small multidrug resistance protein [Hydrogenophaga taeniospiralis CCUG 15921]|uniref:Small multidrug resistance protein n=1 Tax=Hydrogenophaga taeniospiralis CCUG 15921 TaxID=1281780 RepID=A0A9X4NNF0_9BURK|nr:multidrug efflux SMR transporter [Hydrogenophaga taeniospiralis]MDG5974513.1 small multidrug resistance protein [Hydrogenophaga taeniospiralis CCUG 15921]
MSVQTYSWLLLVASIAAEVAGTIALRYADGFTRPVPSLVVVASYAAAIWLMSLAVRHLEVGLAYAVWAGSGTALTAALGILWFSESMTLLRIAGVVMIVIGVVVLNLETQ